MTYCRSENKNRKRSKRTEGRLSWGPLGRCLHFCLIGKAVFAHGSVQIWPEEQVAETEFVKIYF